MPDWSKIGKSNVSRSKSQERQVAKLLQEWSGREFRRRKVQGREHATTIVELTADVIPVEGKFKFSIEAKCEKGFSWEALMNTPLTCKFTEWWHQTCYDSSIVTRELGRQILPMLFFKPTFNTLWVGVAASAMPLLLPSGEVAPDRLLQSSCWYNHLLYDAYEWLGPIAGNVSHTKNKKMVDLQLEPVILSRWKDFAANVDPGSAFEPE